MLGGHLELTSEPGTGTTVVLDLPHGTPAAGTVLVADDDDASFRRVLKGMLTPDRLEFTIRGVLRAVRGSSRAAR
jgi:hypothetical protein